MAFSIGERTNLLFSVAESYTGLFAAAVRIHSLYPYPPMFVRIEWINCSRKESATTERENSWEIPIRDLNSLMKHKGVKHNAMSLQFII